MELTKLYKVLVIGGTLLGCGSDGEAPRGGGGMAVTTTDAARGAGGTGAAGMGAAGMGAAGMGAGGMQARRDAAASPGGSGGGPDASEMGGGVCPWALQPCPC